MSKFSSPFQPAFRLLYAVLVQAGIWSGIDLEHCIPSAAIALFACFVHPVNGFLVIVPATWLDNLLRIFVQGRIPACKPILCFQVACLRRKVEQPFYLRRIGPSGLYQRRATPVSEDDLILGGGTTLCATSGNIHQSTHSGERPLQECLVVSNAPCTAGERVLCFTYIAA